MKIILKIGYLEIMLPNETGVAQIMKALAKGVVVRDRLYQGEVQFDDEELRVEMKFVPEKTRFVSKEGNEIRETRKQTPKRLNGQRTLMLEGGARNGVRLD